ncbi:hypothetical protein AVEN_134218-1 [Araneus ventricosus]|uniref:Uncharacterized protein n=1 Tax=Araneus ventricosus TaxID=182803 RepID=A0A4Y2EQ92_ARAVE|nr:hypothetical protein AVEN_134218-1 [Araneus ventricosus]
MTKIPKLGMLQMAEECVLRLQKSLTQPQLEESGNLFGINLEEYLTVDDDLVVFEGVTVEDNPFRLNDDEEDDDTDASQSLSTSIRGDTSGGLWGARALHRGKILYPVHATGYSTNR